MMDPNRGLKGPFIKIIEQPASKALRFRYECEGRSAGSIPGVNSTPENKTFPTIQIVGYKGRAVVIVSCVTKDHPHRPHPHNLVGREGCKKGVCTMEVNNETMTLSFANLGIQCVKKKDIEEALRVREEIRVDPFKTGFLHRTQPGAIDLNAVRLSFQAFLEGPELGKFTIPLMPVLSDTIYDRKAMSDLVICKLSDCSSSVAGGKEIILLCEKVAKEDISVRLFEERDGHIVWEALGDFTPTQVHKQVAIAFRTPRYRILEVDSPVQVSIQLRRPSDGATSESLPFQLTPLDSDPGVLKRKRQKLGGDSNVLRHLQESENIRMQVSDVSPGLTVKREPPETSPNPYAMYVGKISPYHASRTPSPMDYPTYSPAYQPVGTYQVQTMNFPPKPTVNKHSFSPSSPVQPLIPDNVGHPSGTSPGATYMGNHMGDMTNGADHYMDMGVHCNIELNLGYLNSKDLAELAPIDPNNLSENLSSNLTLYENKNAPKTVSTGENMTDSLSRIAASALNEICGFSDVYEGSPM